MDATRFLGSRYLSAEQLGDKPMDVCIDKVTSMAQTKGEKAGKEQLVLHFGDGVKPLPLNATNAKTCIKELSAETLAWVGAKVRLNVVPTEFAGQPTKGIRLAVIQKPL